MKKSTSILSTMFVLLLVFSAFFCLETQVRAADTELFTYTEQNGKLIVTGLTREGERASGVVNVPSTVGGKTVSSVGYHAFYYEKTKITEIVLPETVNYIDKYAFSADDEAPLTVTVLNSKAKFENNAINNFYEAITLRGYYGSTTHTYAEKNDIAYELIDGIDLSAAKVSLSTSSIPEEEKFIYNEKTNDYEDNYPTVTVELGGKKLVKDTDYTVKNEEYRYVGTSYIIITAKKGNSGKYYGSVKVAYSILPETPRMPRSSAATTDTQIGLSWKKMDVDGYIVYCYNSSTKKYEKIKTISNPEETTFVDGGKTAATAYSYKLGTFKTVDDVKYYSLLSKPVTVYTLSSANSIKTTNNKIKNGYTATVVTKSFKVSQGVSTENGAYGGNRYVCASNLPVVVDFFDSKGNYHVCYSDDSYVYILKFNSAFKKLGELKIKKEFELFGSAICDGSGNYYLAFGRSISKKGECPFLIAKYDSSGKLIKKAKYISSNGGFDAKIAFDAGSCDMAIQGDILVCSFAKEMFNGHQANDVFCVNMKTMERTYRYDSYTSHSFNQRVIATNDGGVLFADHGDGYPRGFKLTYCEKFGCYDREFEYVPFHFYGELGENYNNAELGAVAELSSGYALVGCSAPSLNKNYSNESMQAFVQIINPFTEKSIIKNGSTRSGTCCDEKVKDTGILWLSSNKNGAEAKNCTAVAISKDRIFVAWELYNKKGNFVNSYYAIISSTGEIVQKATPMCYLRLSANEPIEYRNGYVYWTTATAGSKKSTLSLHKLKIDSISKRSVADATVTLSAKSIAYNGKARKVTPTVKYGSTKLTVDTDYIISYKNNKKIGTATVTVTGIGNYAGKKSVTFSIVPKAVTGLKAKYSNGKYTFSWNKSNGVDGYQLIIRDYDLYWADYPIDSYKNTKKTSITIAPGYSYNCAYYVRSYKIVDGKKYYSKSVQFT